MIAWLDALVEQTCDARPALVGVTLGGAVAACFAAEHGDRLDSLVLVDTLGLTSFAPAPRFGAALNAFLAQPDGASYDDLWRVCTFDLDPMRDAMGARWSSLRRYALELLDEPDAMRGLGALMEAFALRPIPAEQLARIAVPTTLVWGRQDLATTLVVAQAASARYGWPLHVIDDCADEPPLERPEAFLAVSRRRSTGWRWPDDDHGHRDRRRAAAHARRLPTAPRRRRLRGVDVPLERNDRPDARARRSAARHARRRRRDRLRTRPRHAGLDPRRRPQHRGHGARGGRRDDRHVPPPFGGPSTRTAGSRPWSPAASSATSTGRRRSTASPHPSASCPRSVSRV